MNLYINFLEVSFGNEIIFLIIGIIFGIGILVDGGVTLVVFIFNSIINKTHKSKYYLYVFLINTLIGLIVSGLVGSSF